MHLATFDHQSKQPLRVMWFTKSLVKHAKNLFFYLNSDLFPFRLIVSNSRSCSETQRLSSIVKKQQSKHLWLTANTHHFRNAHAGLRRNWGNWLWCFSALSFMTWRPVRECRKYLRCAVERTGPALGIVTLTPVTSCYFLVVFVKVGLERLCAWFAKWMWIYGCLDVKCRPLSFWKRFLYYKIRSFRVLRSF